MMEEIVKLVSNYGVGLGLCVLFIWDWVTNRRDMVKTLEAIEKTVTSINGFLQNVQESNDNISKTLDILQQSINTQDKKLDILMERSRRNDDYKNKNMD